MTFMYRKLGSVSVNVTFHYHFDVVCMFYDILCSYGEL